MNYLRLKEAELRHIALGLLDRIQEGIEDPDGFNSWPFFWPPGPRYPRTVAPLEPSQTPAWYATICHLIRDHITGKAFDKEDCQSLADMLNLPVEGVEPAGDVDDRKKRKDMPSDEKIRLWGEGQHPSFGDVQLLIPDTPPARFAAEQLLRYLQCFQEWPPLIYRDPLAACDCGAIFFKKKSHQKYCSGKCRSRAFWIKKRKEGPEYYARKARKNRAAKERQRRAKG